MAGSRSTDVADLEHRSNRIVDQRPDVVHDRLLELAARLRDETPPVEPGTQAATLLGMSGPVGVQIADRGPGRIELRTMHGRVRAEASADIQPTGDGRTALSMAVVVKPQGFAANLMLGVAMRTMPNAEQRIAEGLERGFDDLAVELTKPDDQWDASAWSPPGLPG
jgi:hypothetical protein